MAHADPRKGLLVRAVMFPSGEMKGTAESATWAGAVLGIETGGKIPLANAATGALHHPRFIATSPAAADGEIEYTLAAIVSGYTGGTAGAWLYVDHANPGGTTETSSTDAGDGIKPIGFMLSDTVAFLAPSFFVVADAVF